MKIKSLLGLGAISLAGLSLIVTLPLVLSSCSSNTTDDNSQNPISFTGNEQPVVPNQAVTLQAKVENPENYNFGWSYSNKGGNWTNLEKQTSSTLVIPADKVNDALNHCEFKVTVSHKQTGKIYSAKTKVQVLKSDLTVSSVSLDNPIAVVNVTPITMSVNANTNVANTGLKYQWQYKTKNPSVLLATNDQTNDSGWTDCGPNESSLTIPANQVSLKLNNYEFRCIVSLTDEKHPVSKASDPASVKVGYAVADENIKLEITDGNIPVVQGNGFTLTASETTDKNLNYQWYYKSPSNSSGYAISNVSDSNPVDGWTLISGAKQKNLKIDASHVTKNLENTEFMVVGYEDDKLTYNTATFIVTKVNNAPNKNVIVNVTGKDNVSTDTTATLKASPSFTNESISNYGYQWYYQKIEPKVASSFFKTSLETNKENHNLNWTKIETNGNTDTLSIPTKYITPDLVNYQFTCLVYDQNNKQNYGVAKPTQISSFTQKSIAVDQNVIEDLINNIFMKWTKDSLEANCDKPSSSNPCDPATAKEILKTEIAKQLGILPSNIDNIKIKQGTKILKDGKLAINVVITLNSSNTFTTFNKQEGELIIGDNNKIQVKSENNTLTILNATTNIGVKRISPDFAANFPAYKEALDNIQWTKLTDGYKNVWFNYKQAKPLFEAVAKLFNIPVNYIDELAVSTNGVDYPSSKTDNVVTLKVRFLSGINVQGLNYKLPTTPKESTVPYDYYVNCKGQLWGEITVKNVKSGSGF